MDKLKPCPFCGKYPQTVVDDETEEKFGVKCFNCGGCIYPEKDTIEDAIEAWNRRASDEANSLITADEFRDKMIEICERTGKYPESAHIEMDELMCETLKQLGYSDGIKVFKEQDRWYS